MEIKRFEWVRVPRWQDWLQFFLEGLICLYCGKSIVYALYASLKSMFLCNLVRASLPCSCSPCLPFLWDVIIHSKFKRSVSAPRYQIGAEAPGRDAAHCEDISVTAGAKPPPLETVTAYSGTQSGPLVPARPL